MKYILVTGGVISGVGKGIISSSIGVQLRLAGYRVTAIKIDPYLNEDAGLFSPYEHGETFVLNDGGEVDLDLGNYERFLNVTLTRDNNITTGKLFRWVLDRERAGDYCGRTVQMIPHLTDATVEWIERVAAIPVDGSGETPDVCVIELGGTIGDTEMSTFTAAFERAFMRPEHRDSFMTVHVALVFHPKATGELKTKPMQNAIRSMNSAGLRPDLIIARSQRRLPENLREKIAKFAACNVNQVIGVHDLSNIYKVPLLLQSQGVLEAIQERLHLAPVAKRVLNSLTFTMSHWTNLARLVDTYQEKVTIALVGKYTDISDAYASVNKALHHAAFHSKRKLVLETVNSELLEGVREGEKKEAAWRKVERADGIIVPGGFGDRGIEGMIAACQYAREKKVPFLGVCLGMQCATIEFARNVLGIEGVNSTEFVKEEDKATMSERQKVVIDMPEHTTGKMGGTMRLGAKTTVFLTDNSKLRALYGSGEVQERHRHRYEVNPAIVPELSREGLLFVGMGADSEDSNQFVSDDKENSTEAVEEKKKGDDDLLAKIDALCKRGGDNPVRMEIIEMKDHPYYVGAQFHPEYLSRPLQPSPPFLGLLLAASGQLEDFLATGGTAKSSSALFTTGLDTPSEDEEEMEEMEKDEENSEDDYEDLAEDDLLVMKGPKKHCTSRGKKRVAGTSLQCELLEEAARLKRDAAAEALNTATMEKERIAKQLEKKRIEVQNAQLQRLLLLNECRAKGIQIPEGMDQ